MKPQPQRSQRSLAYLLLALFLARGEAGPLLSGGGSTGANIGEAIGQGVGDAIGQGVGEAAGSGVRESAGPGLGGAAGHRVGEAIHHGLGEAAHVLGNSGGEASRQAENIIRHGLDMAHGYGQGAPGSSSGAWGTNAQPAYGGHGVSGAQSGFGGHSQGTPWGQARPIDSEGSFGTSSQGGSWGHENNGGSFNFGSNAQGAVAQPGYESVRGSSGDNQNNGCTNPKPTGSDESSSSSGGSSSGSSSSSSSGSSGGKKPECDNPENEIRMSGGSGGQGFRGQGGPSSSGIREVSREGGYHYGSSQGNYQGQGFSRESGGGEAISGINTLNSQTPSGLFDFDTLWKNFKSKLDFINWDAIDKNQISHPSARALLYFSRLWEGADTSLIQKRAVDGSQNYNYNQQSYPSYGGKIPAKASRAQPGLLQWMKFW
ncbi:PREDICTED: dermokine [Elephantulus edwardii]|uniref:dermokine n=1 Tax=Elephantulus edwardii TaxID=28737 RepID=UPI0003F09370|nr:PREDICTED: dermokine [Elephantulus edwardii]